MALETEKLTLPTRRLRRTTSDLSVLGFGGAAVGELWSSIPEGQATDAIVRALDAGITYFDTSPWYGWGLPELRLGAVLRGRERDDFVLSTKVGRVLLNRGNARGGTRLQNGIWTDKMNNAEREMPGNGGRDG